MNDSLKAKTTADSALPALEAAVLLILRARVEQHETAKKRARARNLLGFPRAL